MTLRWSALGKNVNEMHEYEWLVFKYVFRYKRGIKLDIPSEIICEINIQSVYRPLHSIIDNVSLKTLKLQKLHSESS